MSARVAVVAGGLSLEREVSLRSGRRVAEALQDLGHEVRRLDLDLHLLPSLAAAGSDLVYLALHGRDGEDGTVQGLLDLLGVPYTGSDAGASARAWDKAVAKGLFARAGIRTPAWVTLSSAAVRDLGAAQVLDRIVERCGGVPLVVKPSQGGASMGVRLVGSARDLPGALASAFRYHDVVLVERFVDGTELAVSLVDGDALPPVEIQPRAGRYDFAARYTPGATEFYAPARLDDTVLADARAAAAGAWAAIGCRHVMRADFVVDGGGTPWLLELDTCPGMTETSLLPLAAAAAGISFPQLCERIVDAARRPAPAAPLGGKGSGHQPRVERAADARS